MLDQKNQFHAGLKTYTIFELCDTRPGRTALGYFGDNFFHMPVFVSKLVKTADY